MHLQGVTLHPDRYPTRDRYPFSLPLFNETRQIAFDAPVTMFVGENGAGKSTLLEALAHACRIHIWQMEATRRYGCNPYEEKLYEYLTVTWADGPVQGSFFGAAVFRHLAQMIDEWASADPGQLAYFGGASLLSLSHGQSLMAFFRSRYRVKGLYLLDEPDTALSPRSQLELLDILTEMGASGHAQFIVATHSPILLTCPGAHLYSFDTTPIATIACEDTDHYRVYRDFLVGRTRPPERG